MIKFTKLEREGMFLQIKKLNERGFSAKQIAKKLNVSPSTIYRISKENNFSLCNYHNELKFDNTVFDEIDNEEKAYWLGFLYADGNVATKTNVITLSLKKDDYEHLKKFKDFLKCKINILDGNVKINDKTYSFCRLCICDKHFKQRLIDLGCIPQKTLKLTFPNVDIFKDKRLIYDFIRGYVDGDGCLTFSRSGRLSITIVGTESFLKSIQSIFSEEFKICKIKKSSVFQLYCTGDKADNVANILYKNANIYLNRKYNRFVVLCRNT